MIKRDTVTINGHILDRIDHPKHSDIDLNKGFNWQTYHKGKVFVFPSLKMARHWAKDH